MVASVFEQSLESQSLSFSCQSETRDATLGAMLDHLALLQGQMQKLLRAKQR
jgi:hypothetical protein